MSKTSVEGVTDDSTRAREAKPRWHRPGTSRGAAGESDPPSPVGFVVAAAAPSPRCCVRGSVAMTHLVIMNSARRFRHGLEAGERRECRGRVPCASLPGPCALMGNSLTIPGVKVLHCVI